MYPQSEHCLFRTHKRRRLATREPARRKKSAIKGSTERGVCNLAIGGMFRLSPNFQN